MIITVKGRANARFGRVVLVGLIAGAVVGAAVGLIRGLVVYPPTAVFALFEVAIPGAVVGCLLGCAVAAVRRRGPRQER